jgi:ubiquinone/menaquinone biosynthesis C-methylase UbiE
MATSPAEIDHAHPVFARVWAAAMATIQPGVMRAQRSELVDGLSGTVVEIGCGSGSAFSHYPKAVERVVAVEPEPYLRAKAQRAAALAPVPVEVVSGVAEHLPLGDDSVDAAVCSLVLCSVPNQAAALAEIARVLGPGGELRYFEHVAEAPGTLGRRTQDWLDRTGLWGRIGGGCHVARETGDAIRTAGFTIDRERTRLFGPPLLLPVRRHLLGVARVPG